MELNEIQIDKERKMNGCPAAGVVEATRGLSSATTLSTQSASLTCRICQDGNSLEPLLNACDCSGSIGLVHAMCLEKWLSQSARESCELCQYEFKTVKKVKNFHQFVCRSDLPVLEKHYILADTACFVVLTPLGLASSYLCLRGANQYYNNDDFWAGFALVLLSTFLTLLYVFWVTIAIRYHYRSFKEWQKESVQVSIVFSDHQKCAPKTKDITNNNHKHSTNLEINHNHHDLEIDHNHHTEMNHNHHTEINPPVGDPDSEGDLDLHDDISLKESFQDLMLDIRTGNEDVRTEESLLEPADVSETAVAIATDDGCHGDRDSALQLLPRERASMGDSGSCGSETPLLNSTKV